MWAWISPKKHTGIMRRYVYPPSTRFDSSITPIMRCAVSEPSVSNWVACMLVKKIMVMIHVWNDTYNVLSNVNLSLVLLFWVAMTAVDLRACIVSIELHEACRNRDDSSILWWYIENSTYHDLLQLTCLHKLCATRANKLCRIIRSRGPTTKNHMNVWITLWQYRR